MIYLVIEDFDPESGYEVHGYSTDLDVAQQTRRDLLKDRTRLCHMESNMEVVLVDQLKESI